MERRSIVVSGTVQGVGFRPFVFGLASRLSLGGFVKNQVGGVEIAVEGERESVELFLQQLVSKAPPLAHIADVRWDKEAARGEKEFHILKSDGHAAGQIVITADAATCDDCLKEMRDRGDRRFGYAFLNCTNCGPRLTIVTGAPYDRERTTMAGFAMCAACRAEYEDPGNRRYHAQPTCCASCGPRLKLILAGASATTGDPLAVFAGALRAGKIGAIKGIGGFHLACDARNQAAVENLRRRKHRDEKPFALMVRDAGMAATLCELCDEERKLLISPRRPIVLLRGKAGNGLAAGIAPGNPFLGVMLPYAPLHHLLLDAMNGGPLVMTSGNRSDEPMAYEDAEALEKLGAIADIFLTHDRPIHVRCDDSVTRVIGSSESPIRRSRGYAPQPIALPVKCGEAILAVGGQLKGTFALGRDSEAIVSHHLGDLDHLAAYRAFEKDVALYEQLFATKPKWIAHDWHPDYATTRYALARGGKEGLKCVGVQHHHAHMASCMAEHGLDERVIGVIFDGTGYGTDGAIWGGEFLVGDYDDFKRVGHLRYVGLPGGDQAVREPWRMAQSYLWEAGIECEEFDGRHSKVERSAVKRMLERKFNTPQTSSMGRLFDAVAGLIDVRKCVSYEGQAAMELEWLASEVAACGAYPFEVKTGCGESAENKGEMILDMGEMIRAVVQEMKQGISRAIIARRFHSTLVKLIGEVCGRIRKAHDLQTVVLSGGTFMNALLAGEANTQLERAGFRVYRHRLAPPNDGGLCLGQLAVGAKRITMESNRR